MVAILCRSIANELRSNTFKSNRNIILIEMNKIWSDQINLLRILTLIPFSIIVLFLLYSSMIQDSTALTSSSSGNTANTTKLISANNTNFNKTNIGSPNVINASGQLLTYTNLTYNIRFEYPSTWVVDDGYNANASGTTFLTIADVFPIISLDNSSNTNGFLHIDNTFKNSHLNAEVYLHRNLANIHLLGDQLISAVVNNTAGHPSGYEIQYGVPANFSSFTPSMHYIRIGKFVGNQVYYTSFSTPFLGENSDLLIKQAKEIGDSLQVLNATK